MHAIQLVWILFSFIYPVFGSLRNITIDDTFGDGFGNFPNYQPNSAWEDANCAGCLIRPESIKAHQGTWTAATYNPDIGELSMSIEFQGTAVYLFFILANQVPFATTETLCNFTIDGQLEGSFHHVPTDSTDLEYDQLVFSKIGLSQDKNHTVAAITSGQNQSYWIGFDYAVVTYDDSPIPTTSTESPSASSQPDNSGSSTSNVNVGAIAGGVIGGVVLIAALIFVFFFYRLRRHRVPPVLNLMEEAPTSHPGGASLQGPSSLAAASHSISSYPHPSSGSLSALGYNNNMSGSSRPPPSTSSAPSSSAHASAVGMTSHTSLLSSPQSPPSLTRRATLRDARQRELESQVAELRQQLTAVQAMPNRRALAKMREADEAEKNNLRNQVADMQERIQQLEAAQHSPWAQGDTDEPPPGYTPVQVFH